MAERRPRRRPRDQASAPERPATEREVAAPDEGPAVDVAAGPSTAAPARRRAETPAARPAERDATAPTSGDRSGPTGSRVGPGGTALAEGTAGGSTGSTPTMAGPTGTAPSTELVGDPGAGSAVEGTTAGAAAGTAVGGGLAGPVGLVAGASIGAVAGALEGLDDDEYDPPPGPFGIPGGGGTGPVDPIYDVARIQRQLEERR